LYALIENYLSRQLTTWYSAKVDKSFLPPLPVTTFPPFYSPLSRNKFYIAQHQNPHILPTEVQSKDLNTITNTSLLFILGGKRCLVTARGFSLIDPFLWAVYFFCCDFLNMQCSWQRLSPLRIDRLLYDLDLLRIPPVQVLKLNQGSKLKQRFIYKKSNYY